MMNVAVPNKPREYCTGEHKDQVSEVESNWRLKSDLKNGKGLSLFPLFGTER